MPKYDDFGDFETDNPYIIEITPEIRDFYRLNRFDQSEVWQTKDGRVISIKDLATDHLNNILNHLEKHVEGWKSGYELDHIAKLSGPLGPSGDVANEDADRWLDQLYEMDAIRWLHGTDLWKALIKEFQSRPDWNQDTYPSLCGHGWPIGGDACPECMAEVFDDITERDHQFGHPER